MTRVLVTGARGFIGKNLCISLRQRKDIALTETDIDTPVEALSSAVASADCINFSQRFAMLQ